MLRLIDAVGVAPAFPWIHPPLRMLQRCNAVGVALIFQWNLSTLQMRSPRNSVRVVLLIARGWRGTSLPRVNIHMEIQRHRCWVFSVKAHLQWNLLWRINQKKRNTYGVVPHTIYTNPGLPALSFGNPGLSKTQHRWRWNIHFVTWITFSCIWIYGVLRRKSTTLTALFRINHTLTQGCLHYRLATLGYQTYNAYSVAKCVLIYYL